MVLKETKEKYRIKDIVSNNVNYAVSYQST